jgi:hypothetical protein
MDDMTKIETPEPSKLRGPDAEARGKRMMKGALVFGVVAATIEMGLLLWFLYC